MLDQVYKRRRAYLLDIVSCELNSIISKQLRITWRNYRLYRNWNSANFFLYACKGEIFKELFTPTWNGIALSVWYVFYVLTLDWMISCDACRQNTTIRNKVTLVPKWCINTAIQSQAFSVHALIGYNV